MSTKSSIAYGEHFHLYHDLALGDRNNHVFLRLTKCPYESTFDGSVTVRIPIAVWEFIRRFKAADFDLAEKTNAELRQEAENRVDALAEHYRKSPKRMKGIFLDARLPRKARIAKLLTRLKVDRAWQRQLLRDIARFEKRDNIEGSP
jgi:hypothetical protein